jgi:nitroreductase
MNGHPGVVMNDVVGSPLIRSASTPSLGLDSAALEVVIATAARAPSVHNTQPWRFRVTEDTIELYADPARRLNVLDPSGRDMVISCGAALFGLRLAVRRAGFRPVAEILPRWPALDPLARVRLGAAAAVGPAERQMTTAVWLRHTHRGPFAPEPLPAGLLSAMRRDAEAEAAALLVVGRGPRLAGVRRLVETAERRQAGDPALVAETSAWTHGADARDGVPARAFPARAAAGPHRLRQRDFDLARGVGTLTTDGRPAPATVVLLTAGDDPAHWLRAGQALHRMLLRAATGWVFGSLHSQPLEVASIREALRARLGVAGAPQMVMQLGRAHTTALTWRRPVADVLTWD